jgi:pSer/pThr/pTyr-binding forkhead associated (FHA) protein
LVEPILLGLKAAFLVLLYVFIWRVIRAASRDLRVPQESFVLAPAQARGGSAEAPAQAGRLVVVTSPSLERGQAFETGPVPLTIGRAPGNDAVLEGDDFASARHARVEARRDGVWILDLGSTNGTWVNGERMDGRRRLRAGDVVRIGKTELRFER